MQVLLHIPGAPQPSSQAFVYATSWWNADTVDSYLRCACGCVWVRWFPTAPGIAAGRRWGSATYLPPCLRFALLACCCVPAACGTNPLLALGVAGQAGRQPGRGQKNRETGGVTATSLSLACTSLPPPTARCCCLPARLPCFWCCRDRSQPIWVSLSEGRTELYREILQLELGHCPYLEQ
jgi:hypothetical protein